MAAKEKDKNKEVEKSLDEQFLVAKEVQTKLVPDFLKSVQAYVVSAKAMQEAGKAMTASMMAISAKLGESCPFRKNIHELADVQYKVETNRAEWLVSLETKLAKTVAKAADSDQKDCAAAQKNMKKALAKYGKYTEKAEKLTKSKKNPAPAEVLTKALEDVEGGRGFMLEETVYMCNKSYMAILSEWCASNEDQLKCLEEMNNHFASLQKLNQESAAVPKPVHPGKDWESIGDEAKLDGKGSASSGPKPAAPDSAPPPKKKGSTVKGGKSTKAKSDKAPSVPDLVVPPPLVSEAPRGSAGADAPGSMAPLKTPRGVGRVRAKWTFNAVAAGDLSMQAGDILTVLNKDNENWFLAYLNGQQGNIPSNYVEPIDDDLDLPPPPGAGGDAKDESSDAESEDASNDDDVNKSSSNLATASGSSEWQEFATDDGHKYLYNATTGETKWA